MTKRPPSSSEMMRSLPTFLYSPSTRSAAVGYDDCVGAYMLRAVRVASGHFKQLSASGLDKAL